MIYILAIRLWIAWLTTARIWLQAARAPFKAAEAKEVERFEAEMLAYNEPVRTTHAFSVLLLAPRMPSSMTDHQWLEALSDLVSLRSCRCIHMSHLRPV